MYELIPFVEVAAIEQALRAKVHTIFLLIYLFTKRKIGFRTAIEVFNSMTTLLLISHLIARSSYTPSGVYDTHVLLPRSTTLNASFPRCKLLHLVRHAEGTHNVASSQHMGPRDVDHHPLSARVSGTTFWDPPLTALGKRQAIALRRSILAEGDRVARGGAADVDVLLRGDRMESLCGRAGGAGARDVAAKAQMKALCSAFDAHNPPASDTHAASILGGEDLLLLHCMTEFFTNYI